MQPFETVAIETAFPEADITSFAFGNYSSRAAEFVWSGGKYYGYLHISDGTLGTLSYVAGDEVYRLFE